MIIKELKKYASESRKKSNEWFFKTGKGQYGYGDKFLGVSVLDIRKIVKIFVDTDFSEIKAALDSKFHEERMAGVLILVEKFKQVKQTGDRKAQKKIYKFYLQNLVRVNNWDLVDISAHRILGQAILDGLENEKILDRLVNSKNMWVRRVAIISTMAFIREGKFDATLRITKKLLGDKEDLMHKAVGWTLREIWKKNPKICEDFLIKNYSKIPRTTLRYAIERMEEEKRQKFLKGYYSEI